MKIVITAVITFFIFYLPAVSEAAILGPYSGTVIDSQSGEPIEGASVLCYWVKSSFNFEGGYEQVAASKLVYSDKNGHYEIPISIVYIGLITLFNSTNIVIYEPGYRVYNVAMESGNPYNKPDPNFKKRGGTIKLDRIPPNFSHKKHYEKIEHTLWAFRDYAPGDSTNTVEHISWEKSVKLNLSGGIPDKEEFLRRVEWEERRGRIEER